MTHKSHDWSPISWHCVACGCAISSLIASSLPCAPSTDDSPPREVVAPNIDWLALNKDFSA